MKCKHDFRFQGVVSGSGSTLWWMEYALVTCYKCGETKKVIIQDETILKTEEQLK